MKQLMAIAVTMCLLAGADAGAGSTTRPAEPVNYHMAVLINGKKIGYASVERKRAGGKVVTRSKVVMTIRRLETAMTVEQTEKHVETPGGKPLGFEASQSFGNGSGMTAEGVVRNGKATVEVQTGKLARRIELDFPKGALMAEGLRLLTLQKGFTPGTKYEAKVFMPLMLKTLDARVTMGPARRVDLLGRVVDLAEATVAFADETGEIEATLYLNADGDALKEVKNMAGMEVMAIACPKQYAMRPGESLDVLELSIVKSPAPLGDLSRARGVTYRIVPTDSAAKRKTKLEFLASPSQKVSADGGAWTVTVAPVAAKGGAFPYKGDNRDALDALKPTAYLQCDANEVRALAVKAVAGAADAAAAARRIEDFVGRHIEKKDLAVGYATALEVARSRQGDCSEHAVLAAAMCRSVGLPAQVVNGLAYVERIRDKENVFVPHAWFRVWIDGQWVDFDAALGFDAGHIAIVASDGDPNEFAGLLNTLGCMRITEAKKR